ncbi:MAG: hypothetical protein IMZ62_19140 [Chloroflexi bacterium]|nr:hypothetical protein [Chloroflexota bacterium]
MERIRYLAGGLLVLTGVVHVLQLLAQPFNVNGVITVIFGVLYLLIGVFLFRRDHRNWTIAGIVLPLLGILLTVMGMLQAHTINMLQIFFVVVDVIVAVCCIYLVTGKK